MKGLLLSVVLIFSVSLFGQEVRKVTIKMVDGSTYTGTIKEKSDDYIILETPHGEMKLKTSSIKKIEEEKYNGEHAYSNPHYSRYFFAPSARPLEKGDAYYQNLMLLGNFFNVGVTNNISLGGGFEWATLILGSPILFFSPKVGFALTEKNHAATGAFIMGIPDDFGEGGPMNFAGIAFGSYSHGTKDKNFTFGIGYGMADGEWATTPALNFNGFIRASNAIGLMTENYLIPGFGVGSENIYLGIHGIRIMGRKSAFDLGLIVAGAEGAVPLPYVGYAIAF